MLIYPMKNFVKIFTFSGCKDINYTEYNLKLLKMMDLAHTILGCTDENSINYDPIANTNNGNCGA